MQNVMAVRSITQAPVEDLEVGDLVELGGVGVELGSSV